MNKGDMKAFWVAFTALVVVHSIVSLAAYQFFTKTSVGSKTKYPTVEVTTSEQRARGEASFASLEKSIVTKSRPTPLVFYIWFGYAGLAAALAYAVLFRLRHV
jgi:hypothetical protein